MLIYAWDLNTIIFIMVVLVLLWLFLSWYMPQKLWKRINSVISCVAFFVILKFTVLNRVPFTQHEFYFWMEYSDEFFREMLMNTFLYFPLGLSLAVVIGPWTVLVGFFLAFFVEAWQYFAGTGLAQGTDVICNTIGCVIGGMGSIIKRREF